MQSAFWVTDPIILFNKNTITQVWPTSIMSTNDRLNAITRLVIILTIVGYLMTRNYRIIITGIVTIASIVVMKYAKNTTDTTTASKINSIKEGFDNIGINKQTTQMPTDKNPLMNVLLPQIQDSPNRPPAAMAYTVDMEEEINKKTQDMVVNNFDNPKGIREKLFGDLGDSFQFDRSMIQFNSTANTTIPNDSAGFTDYCYGGMISCKEGNAQACNQFQTNWIKR